MSKDRVLIVEDEPDTLFILTKLLEKNNYEVKTAKNGKEALGVVDSFQPYVVLADWTMPEMDGIELCNRLKSNEKHKLIYYIILTARTSLRDRVKGLDIGADDFLLKPTENQELLARIRSGVRIYKLQNELKNIEHSKALIEMACTLGHKMNNPLSSLIMSLKSIQDDLNQDVKKQFEEDFMVIDESIKRIKDLVNNLTKLQNPETIEYSDNSKMLKLED
ncbi:MAG: response regulator [Melioribacteraceae bacterium]|nr:response regulator [Melioribacteraceae bacterium]